jgi:predicted metallopeptidase
MGAVNICGPTFNALTKKRQVEILVHELLHAFVSQGGQVAGGYCRLLIVQR